jgi:hypothetical protein
MTRRRSGLRTATRRPRRAPMAREKCRYACLRRSPTPSSWACTMCGGGAETALVGRLPVQMGSAWWLVICHWPTEPRLAPNTTVRPMRVGVLADVHGNAVALRAVLDDASRYGVERWWALGDLVVFGPRPAEVVQLLSGLPSIELVMGNTDRHVVEGTSAFSMAGAGARPHVPHAYGLAVATAPPEAAGRFDRPGPAGRRGRASLPYPDAVRVNAPRRAWSAGASSTPTRCSCSGSH